MENKNKKFLQTGILPPPPAICTIIVAFSLIGIFWTAWTGSQYGKDLIPSVSASETDRYEYIAIDGLSSYLYGFPFSNGETLNRLKTGESYSSGVDLYAQHTAGGRVRFRTDSPSLHIRVELENVVTVPWASLYGTAGSDVYAGDRWIATVSPYSSGETKLEQVVETGAQIGDMVEIAITLPTYASVKSLEIGLERGAEMGPAAPYSVERPIVFYGSSITQGASASRGGLGFPNLVARHFDADLINEGFSGSAMGEEKVARTLAGIDMSAFVMEYDHNAETVEDLANTHYKFYQIIREAHPDIPIVLLSRISGGFSISSEETARRDAVIAGTYEAAVKAGDRAIYFIDGCDISGGNAEMLADGKHPNDHGMQAIANAIILALEEHLSIYGDLSEG